MNEFDKSNWAKPEFSRGYRDNADVFIVERRLMLSILQSFYLHFIKNGSRRTVLDLGCGDGIVTSVIAGVDSRISATLVDGSGDMLKKARERLSGLNKTTYIRSSFQEMIRGNTVRGKFDFIASSLAIHHLSMDEKKALFEKVYRLLKRGGYFLNIDVVLASSGPVEEWFLSLWKDWINERAWDLGIKENQFENIIDGYKDNRDNKPNRLEDQLDALRTTGFADVDCYYKYGIFTIFGGRRAG
ncbi:MAG: class I SAM-dependent methyltransferase [Betaproteobacteria bacterium]